MLEAITYRGMLEDIAHNLAHRGIQEDTIGLLLTRPDLAVGRDILSSLNYYHHTSGQNTDFYLPGYGAYWHGVYPDEREVTMIDGVKWSFSDRMFVQFVNELEKRSRWKYSGESELLMLDYRGGRLCFDSLIQFYLDDMIRDHVISSTASFFQLLFRICKEAPSLNKISDTLGKDKLIQVTKETLLRRLPPELTTLYTQGKYFCVRDCEKNGRLSDK